MVISHKKDYANFPHDSLSSQLERCAQSDAGIHYPAKFFKGDKKMSAALNFKQTSGRALD